MSQNRYRRNDVRVTCEYCCSNCEVQKVCCYSCIDKNIECLKCDYIVEVLSRANEILKEQTC